MPRRPPRACREPLCPAPAARDGYCAEHWRAPYTGYKAHMPAGWEPLKAAVLERDAWTCLDCGAPAVTVDHVIPRAWGGTDDPTNLESVCARCHRMRSGRQSGRARRRG